MKVKSIITTILALAVIASMAYAALKTAKPDDSDSEKYKGWKTYENKEAGFSLKYPGNFVVYEDKINHPSENEYPKNIIFASEPRPKRPDSSLDFYTGGYAIIVRSGENPKSLSLEEWLHPITLENIKKQKNYEIKVAGQKAFIARRLAGELYTLDVDFVTKDKYFSIYLIPSLSKEVIAKYPTHKDAVKNLHLILESFKLIEKSK